MRWLDSGLGIESNGGGSDDAFGYADVRVGDVKTVFRDVVKALVDIQAGRWLSTPVEFHRFKGTPGSELRRQIGSRRIRCAAEDTARTSENVNEHKLSSHASTPYI